LEDVLGVPEKKVLLITVPKSPAFALKNRIQMLTREDEEEDEPVVIDRISSLLSSRWNFYFSLNPPSFLNICFLYEIKMIKSQKKFTQ
jgi:hypothetical protein